MEMYKWFSLYVLWKDVIWIQTFGYEVSVLPSADNGQSVHFQRSKGFVAAPMSTAGRCLASRCSSGLLLITHWPPHNSDYSFNAGLHANHLEVVYISWQTVQIEADFRPECVQTNLAFCQICFVCWVEFLNFARLSAVWTRPSQDLVILCLTNRLISSETSLNNTCIKACMYKIKDQAWDLSAVRFLLGSGCVDPFGFIQNWKRGIMQTSPDKPVSSVQE